MRNCFRVDQTIIVMQRVRLELGCWQQRSPVMMIIREESRLVIRILVSDHGGLHHHAVGIVTLEVVCVDNDLTH